METPADGPEHITFIDGKPVGIDSKDIYRYRNNAVLRVPQINDGLALQIALDELSSGSTEGLKQLLAESAGVDPTIVSLRAKPWTASESDELSYTLVGKLDHIEPEAADRGMRLNPPKPILIELLAEVESRKPYRYVPLNKANREIRLLKLGETQFPDHFDRLHIQTYPLESAPKYCCLSYVWGAPERFIPVNCDGKYVMTTQNLYHAICTTFARYPDMYLWADGICINQNDLDERSQQVRLMGDIYRACQRVLASPGHFRYVFQSETGKKSALLSATSKHEHPTDGDCEDRDCPVEAPRVRAEEFRDMTTARPAISLMNLVTRVWTTANDTDTTPEWSKLNLPNPENEGSDVWNQVFAFWEEDWLWRTWVLPECVLSPKVIVFYGEYVVSLDAMMEFWNAARSRVPPPMLRHGIAADMFNRVLHMTPVTTFLTLRAHFHKQEEAHDGQTRPYHSKEALDLLELLALSRSNFVTDPRDKLYALLGLASDEVARSISQSYHESNSVQDTFIELAQKSLQHHTDLRILEYAGLTSSIPDLPSWAPDWTFQTRSRLQTHLYNCTLGSSPFYQLFNDTQSLSLQSVSISTIAEVGPAWRYYDQGAGKMDVHVQPFLPMISRSGEKLEMPPFRDEDARCAIFQFALTLAQRNESCRSLYADDLELAIARTLCADVTWTGERVGGSSETLAAFEKSFRAFRTFYAQGPDPENSHKYPGSTIREHVSGVFHWLQDFSEEEGEKLTYELWPFAMALQNAQRGRRFARLEGGAFAVVPLDAAIGDAIVLFQGGRVPFVVRMAGGEDGREGSRCRLVGDCYVHGIMDGELLSEWEKQNPAVHGETSRLLHGKEGKYYAVQADSIGSQVEWMDIKIH